ncbi:MAG: SRPBCC family protein [Ilumatobacteraceae bacterium]
MELVSDRRYPFPVPPDALWSALAATDDYQGWWPWLRAFDADGLRTGDEWRCTVRPPLPYTLRFTIHLDHVDEPRLVTSRVTGDISGVARIDIAPTADGSEIHLRSALTPSNRAFGFLAAIARPIVRRGHDWVLDTGAQQFVSRALAEGE